MEERENKKANEQVVEYSTAKKTLRFFSSFNEADEASREEIRRLSPEQRIDMVVNMISEFYKKEIAEQLTRKPKLYFKRDEYAKGA